MSHLFVNSKCPDVLKNELLKFKNKKSILLGKHNIEFYYDNNLWGETTPIIEKNQIKLFVCGWFVNKDYKLNDIDWLFDQLSSGIELKEISLDIIAGIFIAGYFDSNQLRFFVDPFSLSPHYYNLDGNLLKIAPTPSIISSAELDVELQEFLESQGHLFGNLTTYKDVKRFVPGDIITEIDNQLLIDNIGFSISETTFESSNIFTLSKQLISSFDESQLSIALSAGFDSRLLLSTSKAKYSYTWGQETSLDIVNAKKLASEKGIKHLSFGFQDNIVSDVANECCHVLFDGSVKAYNPQFFENYKYVATDSENYNVALDGYLGDVLQRGVYGCHGGKKGELLKIFPFLTSKVLNSKTLLNARYSKVPDRVRHKVIDDFIQKTESLSELDDLQKVIYYEFLYGRGLRYITTASVCMNGLFKTVVPVFASRYIFSVLIKQKFDDVIGYKVFSKIWKNAPDLERNMVSEGLYAPSTNRYIIPYLNFCGRMITNYHPKYMNYTKR